MARELVELGRGPGRRPSLGQGMTGKPDVVGIAAGALPVGLAVSYLVKKGAGTGDYILGAFLLAAGGYVVAKSAKIV